MPSQAQRSISLFRTVVLAGATALLITSAALPMPAQNSVPASAVQAARTPQFASRLAHPTLPTASRPNQAPARQGSRNGPPQGGPIYDNGPINGTTDAWTINSGFVVSDTITVSASPVTGMNFGAWLFPGDVLESVQISITSSEFGGTTYFNGVVNFTQSDCSSNQYGFNICTETSANFSGPDLPGGTYWVNLSNAVVNNGDPVYWDENSGVGCESSGCPSLASNNSVGTIPSEAFTMLGTEGSPTCFESGGNLQIIHDFTQQEGGGYPGGPNGVTIDRAGNLYGTTINGGNNGAGLAYKLSHFANWLLDPLFSFFGGNGGGDPTGAILGPNGTLYGGAQGGIQNCGTDGSQYCGLVFNLTPQPTACLTSLCSWTENVPYRFSSESDGSGVINVSAHDQQGNLYGTTSTGGTHGAGTVFELTPSGRGWTKTTLYSFTGGVDGGDPTQVLVGNDGNLYGVAGGGLLAQGVVFQLTPSGGGWTESVIHIFGSEGDRGPSYLVQDSAGNLYGAVSIPEIVLLGESPAIFVLEKTGSGWAFSESNIAHCSGFGGNLGGAVNNLAIDAAGKLYGTGYDNARGTSRSPGQYFCYSSYIFKASYDSGGWHYQDLDLLPDTFFDPSGSLALDSSGNLYGTTNDCGTNNAGTVWQLSP